ncbi:MAG: beta-ketoacyl-ACP reductase [SAR324 cluster bacterium]|uniref:3-oxoacyl-[acyl-carrier-protein] reductase n=1 Tax=SAR324 cluster bacterium TaxID=2024889 RepID=A0A2A4T297_9DELT|nr:MAG: beta-ketoacyl-ACP reductase [SAR324 cluster bacterium]
MIDLKGSIALVTGGTRGIGKAIVLSLAKAGATVCFTGRSPEPAATLEAELKSLGAEGRFFQGDIADFEQSQEMVKSIVKEFGKIDILVNNAGITRDMLFMKMKPADWDQVINTNLTGMFNTCKAVVRPMMKKRYGRIINISSVVGFTGNPGQTNYAASKAGMIGFSKSFAKEVASRNITCNVIAPGFIATEMTDAIPEAEREKLNATIPMQRMGTVDDIANGVLFLASSMASYVTGTTLHINGGMY